MVKTKINKTFAMFLGVISILGFLSIILQSLLNFNFLADNQEAILLMILGIGLLFEGKIFKLFGQLKDGINSNEFGKLVTSLVGLVVFSTGILTLFEISSEVIAGSKLIASLIAMVIIILEVFVID